MKRRNRHSKSSSIKVIFAGRVVRHIGREEFVRLRDRGRALPIYNAHGQLVSCELTNNHPGDGPIPSQRSGPTITAHEMVLYAGRVFRGGKSRTENLNEAQRLERAARTSVRTGRRMLPEDAVERVAEKVRLQTTTANFHDGRDRAPRVYARA